jgi:hypothetical protein
MTTSITTISTIIIGQIVYMAAKTDTAEYREADLETAHADSNEDMQADTKINHGKKSATYVGNLNTG